MQQTTLTIPLQPPQGRDTGWCHLSTQSRGHQHQPSNLPCAQRGHRSQLLSLVSRNVFISWDRAATGRWETFLHAARVCPCLAGRVAAGLRASVGQAVGSLPRTGEELQLGTGCVRYEGGPSVASKPFTVVLCLFSAGRLCCEYWHRDRGAGWQLCCCLLGPGSPFPSHWQPRRALSSRPASRVGVRWQLLCAGAFWWGWELLGNLLASKQDADTVLVPAPLLLARVTLSQARGTRCWWSSAAEMCWSWPRHVLYSWRAAAFPCCTRDSSALVRGARLPQLPLLKQPQGRNSRSNWHSPNLSPCRRGSGRGWKASGRSRRLRSRGRRKWRRRRSGGRQR